MSDSLQPHGLQLARLPCPSTTPRACSNSCPTSRWCHPTILGPIPCFTTCQLDTLRQITELLYASYVQGEHKIIHYFKDEIFSTVIHQFKMHIFIHILILLKSCCISQLLLASQESSHEVVIVCSCANVVAIPGWIAVTSPMLDLENCLWTIWGKTRILPVSWKLSIGTHW